VGVIGNESVAQPSTPADTLFIAGWRIHASTNRISKGEKTIRLEPRTMGVLVYLASRPGEVVTREQLEQQVWRGMVVGYDALSNAITKLRRAFDDDPRHPKIIETIPKVGYRLIGEVSHSSPDTESPGDAKRLERKLTAILYADVAGYSRLTGEDEEGTHRILRAYLDAISQAIKHHNGEVVHYAGDAVLAEFATVVGALTCAVAVQRDLAARNASQPADRTVEFRIGINLGDIIIDRHEIYGDGVNMAARLESLADPGGICISESVRGAVGRKLPLSYEFLGEQSVKNIAEPVRAYRVLLTPQAARAKPEVPKRRLVATAAALVALVIVVVLVAWFKPWRPSEEPGSTALPVTDEPSIAVLPFTNLSGDKEQEYFADGLSDDLITSLSKISGLLVIARNSTFAYKDKQVDVRTAARELGVKFVLEGSTRRVDEQVRVNAQLIDAATGGHLWAERYDDTMANIFAVQDKITRKIVAALAVELTAEEKERVSRKDTDNIDAYDAFLLGWEHYLRDTPEDLAKAVSHLGVAVRLDPNFARAHAALGEAYQRSISRGWWRTLGIERWEVKEQLQQHLQMAAEQPTPIAHQAKSRVLLRARRHEEAIAELERALVLDPNSFLGHVNMAWALSLSGQPEKAISYAEKAKRLDPGTRARALWELGFAQFGMDQFEAAVTALERAIKLSPELPQWPLMAAYAHLGSPQKAAGTRKAYFKLRGWEGPHNVSTMLNYYPYKRRVDEERFARGLLGAGVPGYYKMTESNKLPGEEIRALTFGRVRTGINTTTGQQYWVTYFEDGKATRRGGRQGTDTGKAWIEGDSLCEQWQKSLKGHKRCMSVYLNPDGTSKGLDEYVSRYDIFVISWSVVD
jgi:TolB-like protein/class 3 adenylate cyclase